MWDFHSEGQKQARSVWEHSVEEIFPKLWFLRKQNDLFGKNSTVNW
jgi:hypothetical protein